MFLFSPVPGKMIQFDYYFSKGLKPPTSFFPSKNLVISPFSKSDTERSFCSGALRLQVAEYLQEHSLHYKVMQTQDGNREHGHRFEQLLGKNEFSSSQLDKQCFQMIKKKNIKKNTSVSRLWQRLWQPHFISFC